MGDEASDRFSPLGGPALAWVPIGVWIQSHVDAWWALRVELPLSVRVILMIDNTIVRWGVFAIIAAVLVSPLLVLAASLLSSGEWADSQHDVLVWTVLAVVFWGTLAGARSADPGLLVSGRYLLEWAGILTYVFAWVRHMPCSGRGAT